MAAQSFIFKFPRTPSVAITKTAVPLGHFGTWIDGVTAYSASDGKSYNSLGVWNRNAYYWEASSFDTCNGHCDSYLEYHIHWLPKCLFTYSDSTSHSPLIGFAFDGYPIYGPYGYSSANNSASSIKLIATSYRLRSITTRTTLSNGTVLLSAYYGPNINSTYPLGSYMEDYEYLSGNGDLDQYNGRWCVTPEYPNGTYAYFVTIDSSFTPQYPYILGPYFYGSPVTSNLVTGTGKIPTEKVTTYYSYS